MTRKKGEIVELQIEDLLLGGKGTVQEGLMTYELRDVLPGDVVRAKIRRIKGSRILADVQDFIHQGFPRIEPRCTHFGECGGCTWQHIRYADQLQLKETFVKRCLEKAGGFQDVPIGELRACEQAFFYRNKMEFSFGEIENTLEPDQRRVGLGLHIRGRYDKIFDLKQCFLQSESSNALVDLVRRWVNEHRLSAYHLRSHEGLLRFLMIREGKWTGESMVNLIVSQPGFDGQDVMAKEITDGQPEVKCFVLNVNSKKAQIAVGTKEIVVAGKRTIREKIGDLSFDISANSFFQTNTRQAAKLYDTVIELADLQGTETVYDLYCGAGAIALYLSKHVKSVLGVESVGDALQDARHNARLNAVGNCQFIQGEVEDLLPDLYTRWPSPDVIIVDPPRAGLHKKAIQGLIELGAPKIIYVSCNPESMAQNARALYIGGYVLEFVQPIDMFPHTYHVECVTRLRRAR